MLLPVLVRPSTRGARPALLGEVVVVVLLVRVYDWIRQQAATRSAEAEHHALDLLGLERHLRLDVEHPANDWIGGHPHLELLAAGWYQFAHIPVTIGLLAWCYWRRPAAYRPARNALVLINLIGLAVFLVFPVMPPRLLPGAGFADSLAASGLGSAPAGPVSADEFAAMPSLHLAWATWVAVLAATLITGRTRRLLVVAYPLTTAAVTVATANHYVLDVVAGVAVALLAVLAVRHCTATGSAQPPAERGVRGSPAPYAGGMGQLLVVEDDETIGSTLQSGLAAHGHSVTWVRAGRPALREATLAEFDLVLLDLGLPDLDGVEVCRQLRTRQPGCVIVMLTARQDEMDVVVGLEAGADDYLTKPFRFAELRARVHAHLRRGPTSSQRSEPVRQVGALTVDTAARRCLLDGTEVALRAKEFDLLARLAADPGMAVTRDTLMSDVWDEHWSGSTKTLDVHVAALRRRLDQTAADHGARPVRITTLRGHGYRLEQD